MSPEIIGIIGVLIVIILTFTGMWIGLAMALVGFLGFLCLHSINPSLVVLGTVPYLSIAYYPMTTIPMFVFMGVLLSNTGVCEDLYNTANKWIGQIRGGLGVATVLSCA